MHWAGSSPGSRDLRTPDLNAQTGYMGGHACTGQSVHVREVPPDACTLKQMHIASAQSRTRNVQRTVASAQQTNGRKLKSRSPDGMVIRAFSPRLSCEMPSSQPFTTCPDLTRNLKWRPVGFLVLGSIGPAGHSRPRTRLRVRRARTCISPGARGHWRLALRKRRERRRGPMANTDHPCSHSARARRRHACPAARD